MATPIVDSILTPSNLSFPSLNPGVWSFSSMNGYWELLEGLCTRNNHSVIDMNTQTAYSVNLLWWHLHPLWRSFTEFAKACACALRFSGSKLKQSWAKRVVGRGGVLKRFRSFLKRWGSTPFDVLQRCAPLIEQNLEPSPALRSKHCFLLTSLLDFGIQLLNDGQVSAASQMLHAIDISLQSCLNEEGAQLLSDPAIISSLTRFARAWTVDAISDFQIGGHYVDCTGNCLASPSTMTIDYKKFEDLIPGLDQDVVMLALAANWIRVLPSARERNILEVYLFPHYNSVDMYGVMQHIWTMRGFHGYIFFLPIAEVTMSLAVDCVWGNGEFVSSGIAASRQSGIFRQTGFPHASGLRVSCVLPRTLPALGADGVSLRIRFFKPDVHHPNIAWWSFDRPNLKPVAELPLIVHTASRTSARSRMEQPRYIKESQVHICTQPMYQLHNVESKWSGLISLWIRYHLALNISSFVVYDTDGSFANVVPDLMSGPLRHRITYFPRLWDG